MKEISVLKGIKPCYSASEVVINPKEEKFETTEDIIRWVNRKRLEILKEEIEDLKKVSQ